MKSAIVGLACLLLGCGGQTTGTNTEAPGDAGTASRLEGDGASNNAPGTVDARASGDGSDGAPELTAQPTVWIGETDPTVTYPAGFDGGDVVPYQPDPTPPEKVVLILSAMGGSVAGTIAFGDTGPPPSPVDPKQAYPPEPTMRLDPNGQTFALLPENWKVFPYPGFSYSLVSSELSGSVLNLAFVPSELWRDWCAIQDATLTPPALPDDTGLCVCDAGTCRATSSPIRRINLTVSGNTMQGVLVGEGSGVTPPVMRLQRVK